MHGVGDLPGVPVLLVGPGDCSGDAGTGREWLLTDGLGGYAMGTAHGLRTRRYHGLLVVATRSGRPSDPSRGVSQRHLALASLDPVLVRGDSRVRLASHEWTSGVVDPAGSALLTGVEVRPGSVAHRWSMGDVVVEREVAMVHGRPAVAVRHRIVRAPGPVHLDLDALGTWRDAHGERHEGGRAPRMDVTVDGAVLDNAWRISGPGFVAAGEWYSGVHYREETARGLADTEDLWHLGRFGADLDPGGSLDVLAWADDSFAKGAGLGVSPQPVDRVVEAARARAVRLVDVGAGRDAGTARQVLTGAAAHFVTGGEGTGHPAGVVAGYPWFGEWSRDVMISYEGLMLATGRAEDGAGLLRRFAATLSEGMLANTTDADASPACGAPPASDASRASGADSTVDATLWFLHAVRRHVDVIGDHDLGAELAPALYDVVDRHVTGTGHGIGVDPADGLLQAGRTGDADIDAGFALTWMDARIGGRAVTPRHGKPVEVNALWVSGLAGTARILRAARQPSARVERVERLHDQARAAFVARYVDAAGRHTGAPGGLFDVVDSPDAGWSETGDDATLRPNQVFAASLPDGPLAGDGPGGPEPARALLRAVAPLVTPLGMRTRAPGSFGYHGVHRGPPESRDAAYHQGTVWPWLVGAYVEALRRAGMPVDGVLDGLVGHLGEAGLTSVSQTADGDAPHRPTGCPFQAWSVAEVLRSLSG